MTAVPFQVEVSQELLSDLQARLERTRLPDEIVGSGWEYGTNRTYLAELIEYWRDGYDWREQERLLNALPQYRAKVGELNLHFIHQPGRGVSPTPLLMLHGWPGSPWDFARVITRLAGPDAPGSPSPDGFSIVAPSLPGFGFSDPPRTRGMNLAACGDLILRLMTDVLGYDRFIVQGGDWGSAIGTRIAEVAPNRVIGLHLNMIVVALRRADESAPLDAEERIFLGDLENFRQEEAGYQWIQSTRPQTLAYALNDSPVGLLAWLVEKFRSWSDCRGDLSRRFSRDDLINAAMIFWVTGSIGSSMRLYYEARRYPWTPVGRIGTPTAVAVFPRELMRPPRSWVEQVYNVQRWTTMASGGHFAPLEEPELLAADIAAFAAQLR
jgi:pimeloyl-ACP methyl ester carboxylesterase